MSANELEWSSIKVNYTNENVIMSREDFSLLVKNIEQMKFQLDNQLYVEENKDSSFDSEINSGNLSIYIIFFLMLINLKII
jgi:hypothetical protein